MILDRREDARLHLTTLVMAVFATTALEQSLVAPGQGRRDDLSLDCRLHSAAGVSRRVAAGAPPSFAPNRRLDPGQSPSAVRSRSLP